MGMDIKEDSHSYEANIDHLIFYYMVYIVNLTFVRKGISFTSGDPIGTSLPNLLLCAAIPQSIEGECKKCKVIITINA